jgi:hypothetical protein
MLLISKNELSLKKKPVHMKTTTLQNKHNRVRNNLKFATDYKIIIQLYFFNKAALQKNLPVLPTDDERRNIITASPAVTERKNNLKHSLTEYLHTWANALYKRVSA